MPNTHDSPNPLDLPRQVAYVEHVAANEAETARRARSLGCFDLSVQSARRVPATGVSPKEALLLEN